MGKLILHEFAFNKVNGKSLNDAPNSLAYSKVTSCLTVTCICSDGTIAGGHIVMIPFSFYYVTSHLAGIIVGKEITKVVVIGSSIWNNPNTLEALYNSKDDTNLFSKLSGASIAAEKKYLAEIIAEGSESGIQKSIEMIFGNNNLDIFVGLYGGELDIVFTGGADGATVDIQGSEMEFPYAPQPSTPKASPETPSQTKTE